MSGAVTVVKTRVARSDAALIAPPSVWSYSSLHQVERCPRRFALSRASYPDLWDGRGYPPLPTLASLFGDVVHEVLEKVTKALAASDAGTLGSAEAASVLRELGGLSNLVEAAIADKVQTLNGNPRFTVARASQLARELRARVSDARSQVQTYMSRASLEPRASVGDKAGSGGVVNSYTRRRLGGGSYAEVWLTAETSGLRGCVDLITIRGNAIELVDYKTGEPSDAHREQLRFYALLWLRDLGANPEARAATHLRAAYREFDNVVAAPTELELQTLEQNLVETIAAAERDLLAAPPLAQPSRDVCDRCPVRQLCDPYWLSMAADVSRLKDGELFDCEGEIESQNGRRSWWLRPVAGQTPILIRTPSESVSFIVGSNVRLLDLRFGLDPEITSPIAMITSQSEVFLVGADHESLAVPAISSGSS